MVSEGGVVIHVELSNQMLQHKTKQTLLLNKNY